MEKTNTNQNPTQNPSKVVIVPKPPKGGKAAVPETPELSAEELEKGKVETVKAVQDTVKTGNVADLKTEVPGTKK